ncbi:MAG TPA: hypothetical protein VFN64_11445 [Burkholderiaceae bacterium]|nr:hypothetical protein [Burkholderiaceae bacterium]
MTIEALLDNRALRHLTVGGWDADRLVAYYEDGEDIDAALAALDLLSNIDDEECSLEAQAKFDALFSARLRARG